MTSFTEPALACLSPPQLFENRLANDALERLGLDGVLQRLVDQRLVAALPGLGFEWILQPALGPALDAMVGHGLALDALVRPLHLPALRQLCRRHPALRVVIDHAAKPEIAAAAWQPWADALAAVAAKTQAVCKLSGLLTEAGPAPAPRATRRWADPVLACFGAQRVPWGSDWLVVERAGSYVAWWDETQAVLAGLSPGDRADVLGATARRVYRL